jgi:hypothetical protein
MMRLDTARQLANEIAYLSAYVGLYNARYGGSAASRDIQSVDELQLKRDILDTQARIAALLPVSARQDAFCRYGRWWETCDVMKIGLVEEMASEAFHLINACAYNEASGRGETNTPRMHALQASIAGMLQPETLGLEMVAAGE